MQTRHTFISKFVDRKIQIVIVIVAIVFLESFIRTDTRIIDDIMRYIFGYISFYNRNIFLASIIKFILPQIGIFLLWGNYIRENVVVNYELIFTRTRKSSMVLWKYMVQLVMKVSITVIFMEVLLYVIYFLKGYYIESFSAICLDLGLYCIYMLCLLGVTNIISLGVPNIFSTVIVLIIEFIFLEITYHLLQNEDIPQVYFFLPTSSVMLVNNVGTGYVIKLLWAVYLIGIFGLCFIFGCWYTNRKEYY